MVSGNLETSLGDAGVHVHQEGDTVGFGTLEATRHSFSAQTGASQEAHYGGGEGQ